LVQAGSGAGSRPSGDLSVYDQDQVDQRPTILRLITPVYPPKARQMNIEGTVVVKLIVDTAGLPKACAIHFTEQAGYFEEAALNAAQKMRFMPGKIRGTPVNTLVLLPFAFKLR
jgi:protein TonB